MDALVVIVVVCMCFCVKCCFVCRVNLGGGVHLV